ncbi:MAG: enoyl-CoA hydratase-related protein [Desulfobacteraceae bacterium]
MAVRREAHLCRMYTVREAEAMGRINKAVPAEDLEKETEKWAQEITEKSPRALAKKMHNAY